MNESLVFGILLVLALSFDFLNGFHDSANVVATMIASRALSPRFALGLGCYRQSHWTASIRDGCRQDRG